MMTKYCLFLCGIASLAWAGNWPEFRGPKGDGHAEAKGLPTTWSETKNIEWKTGLHGKAWSTPVVWGKDIWLTTATENGKEMSGMCIDRASGKILFDRVIFTNEKVEGLGGAAKVNAYGSPSPAIEAGRVYLNWGSYGTTCMDTRTREEIWQRRDLPCQHFRGPGSSLVIYRHLLILTMDGVDVQYITALDKMTGKTVWKTDRTTDYHDLDSQGKPRAGGDFRKAYSTPLIFPVNGTDILFSSAAKAAYAYEPLTGKEIWQINFTGFSGASRPVADTERVYMNSGYGKPDLYGVRHGGSGNCTKSHIVWKQTKGMPKRSSPLLIDGLLYVVSDEGVATCVEAATGEVVWQDRMRAKFSGSPIFAEGRIYCFAENGSSWILKPGRTFEVIAENKLDTGCMASPLAIDDMLIIRTKSHLYGIKEKS
ncbi:MAG: PQQ-binding-like beta-propeller repeat protein [Verrucomicrobiota bacterium]